ncbi:diphthine--ammonia ligase [Candidatus Woesearchaeota archaeon]|nr:diphthine--ammonia ligase [Candidatus Woesearchaeota archaeon]
MNVAIMYSGGKDSNYAVQHALEKGWNIKYLLSVKPTRTDCYLFHFATVEHTPLQAEALGLKHYLLSCNVADPKKEAAIVEKFVAEKQKSKAEKVDAVLLGGTGLQATQIRSIQEALMPYGIEVFAAHSGDDHETIFRKMLADGFDIIVTQVAAEGAPKWLGKTITKENFEELKKDSERYGFHLGFDGGHMDTFVVDAPTFVRKIIVDDMETVMEDAYSGHVVIKKLRLDGKKPQKEGQVVAAKVTA